MSRNVDLFGDANKMVSKLPRPFSPTPAKWVRWNRRGPQSFWTTSGTCANGVPLLDLFGHETLFSYRSKLHSRVLHLQGVIGFELVVTGEEAVETNNALRLVRRGGLLRNDRVDSFMTDLLQSHHDLAV